MLTEPSALVSSDSSDESPLCLPCSSRPVFQANVKPVAKHDDDNFCECSQPSNMALKACQPPEFEERKIGKLLSSKLLKGTPTISDDGNATNTGILDPLRVVFITLP